jgi:hypothetical protein
MTLRLHKPLLPCYAGLPFIGLVLGWGFFRGWSRLDFWIFGIASAAWLLVLIGGIADIRAYQRRSPKRRSSLSLRSPQMEVPTVDLDLDNFSIYYQDDRGERVMFAVIGLFLFFASLAVLVIGAWATDCDLTSLTQSPEFNPANYWVQGPLTSRPAIQDDMTLLIARSMLPVLAVVVVLLYGASVGVGFLLVAVLPRPLAELVRRHLPFTGKEEQTRHREDAA